VPLRTPLSAVTSSFLAARSTASSFRLAGRPRGDESAGCDLPPRPDARWSAHAGQDDALLKSCPPGATRVAPGLEVRTGRGACDPKSKRPYPSVQALRIKQGTPAHHAGHPAPAVSDRTDFRKPPEAFGAYRKNPIGSGSFRTLPQDHQKELGPNRHRFREARKGAPTHWAGTPWAVCRAFQLLCQVESAAWEKEKRQGRGARQHSLRSATAPLQRHGSRVPSLTFVTSAP
jgi:hypothetical protein